MTNEASKAIIGNNMPQDIAKQKFLREYYK